MTANKLLHNYLTSLNNDAITDLKEFILNILEYLAKQEINKIKAVKALQNYRDADLFVPQYLNDKLWTDICSISQPSENNSIELPVLRTILEKYKILENEKDGM